MFEFRRLFGGRLSGKDSPAVKFIGNPIYVALLLTAIVYVIIFWLSRAEDDARRLRMRSFAWIAAANLAVFAAHHYVFGAEYRRRLADQTSEELLESVGSPLRLGGAIKVRPRLAYERAGEAGDVYGRKGGDGGSVARAEAESAASESAAESARPEGGAFDGALRAPGPPPSRRPHHRGRHGREHRRAHASRPADAPAAAPAEAGEAST